LAAAAAAAMTSRGSALNSSRGAVGDNVPDDVDDDAVL